MHTTSLYTREAYLCIPCLYCAAEKALIYVTPAFPHQGEGIINTHLPDTTLTRLLPRAGSPAQRFARTCAGQIYLLKGAHAKSEILWGVLDTENNYGNTHSRAGRP